MRAPIPKPRSGSKPKPAASAKQRRAATHWGLACEPSGRPRRRPAWRHRAVAPSRSPSGHRVCPHRRRRRGACAAAAAPAPPRGSHVEHAGVAEVLADGQQRARAAAAAAARRLAARVGDVQHQAAAERRQVGQVWGGGRGRGGGGEGSSGDYCVRLCRGPGAQEANAAAGKLRARARHRAGWVRKELPCPHPQAGARPAAGRRAAATPVGSQPAGVGELGCEARGVSGQSTGRATLTSLLLPRSPGPAGRTARSGPAGAATRPAACPPPLYAHGGG
jgi:hypothetical protein